MVTIYAALSVFWAWRCYRVWVRGELMDRLEGGTAALVSAAAFGLWVLQWTQGK